MRLLKKGITLLNFSWCLEIENLFAIFAVTLPQGRTLRERMIVKLPESLRLFALIVLICIDHVLGPLQVFAQAAIQPVPNDDLLYINAKEMSNYFDFDGCPLKQVVRVNVEYQQTDGQSYSEKRPYEELWYDGQHALGVRRYRDFDLHHRDPVYVFAEASSPAEISALANALVRVFLDASFNRNSIVGIVLS